MTEPAGSPKKAPPARRSESSGSDEPARASSGGWLIVIVCLFLLGIYVLWKDVMPGDEVAYTFLWNQAESRNIDWIQFRGQRVAGKWKTPPPNPRKGGGELNEQFHSVLPFREDESLLALVRQNGATVKPGEAAPDGMQSLIVWGLMPSLITIFIVWMILRRASDPMQSGMFGSFTRSPAKRVKSTDQKTMFDDVAAMKNAKSELQEIVEFLKNPAKFQRLGAQIPKGVLLVGSPGTGKTLLARATAGEAGVPFYTINGSEFIQMFVGVGASRVRDLFRTAKENSPCILFIDEIDAVGRIRGAGLGGGHDEREQTLNQILSEMDGFQQTEAVIVLAATNRPDVLDPALLRPGRFDRHITIDRPTREGREQILKVHVRKVPLADDVDLAKVAGATIGFSGAELKNLVNEAALHAAREGRESVIATDFEAARDRVTMGPVREEILTEHERAMTAYHEAGHALLGWHLPDVDIVHKVTIVPRGRALGVTQFVPDEERLSVGERRLHGQLALMLAGRAAEKLVFDEYTAGAEDDLKRATQIARRMVAYWGMSPVIGPVAFRQGEEHPFLGKEIHEQREFSEETARIIDQEVQGFLLGAAKKANDLLELHRGQLDALAKGLLDQEELQTEDITALIGPSAPRSSAARKTTQN